MNAYLLLLGLILFIILLIIHFNTEKQIALRTPAEYGPQEYVILISPDIDTTLSKQLKPELITNVNKERLYDMGLGEGLNTIADVQAQEIKALRGGTKVIIMFRNKENYNIYMKIMKKHGVNSSDFRPIFCKDTCDIWARDTGPIVVYNANKRVGIWARWVQWGYYQPPGVMYGPNYIIKNSNDFEKAKLFEQWSTCDIPNKVAKCICDNLEIPTVRPMLGDYMYAGECGNKSFNGKGSLICSEVVEMQRNPYLTKQQLENIYKKYYGINRTIWVGAGVDNDTQAFNNSSAIDTKTKHGNGIPKLTPLEKDGKRVWVPIGTGGHIDEWCRFVGDNKIVLSYVPNYVKLDKISEQTKIRMEQNYQMIKKNYPDLEIYRIPDAPLFYVDIDSTDGTYSLINSLKTTHTFLSDKITIVSAGSYINYMISNQTIILPKYHEEGSKLASDATIKRTDKEAQDVMQKLFPDRKIVRINNLPLNFGGGGFNCTCKQIPVKLN
jgi:agmatine deiminase